MEGKLGTRLKNVSTDDAQQYYEEAARGTGTAVLLHLLPIEPSDNSLPAFLRLPLNCIDTAAYRGCLVYLYFRDKCSTRLWGYVGSTFIAKACTDRIEGGTADSTEAAAAPGYVDAKTARQMLYAAERKTARDATFGANLEFAAVPKWVFAFAGLTPVTDFKWYTGDRATGTMDLSECRHATLARIELHRYIGKHRQLTAKLTGSTLSAITALIWDRSITDAAKRMLFLDSKTDARRDEIAFRMLLETLQMLYSMDKRVEVEVALAAFVRGERVIARIRAETVLFGDCITKACGYLMPPGLALKRVILGRAFPYPRTEHKDALVNRIAAEYPMHTVVYGAPFESMLDLIGKRGINLYEGDAMFTQCQLPTFALAGFTAIMRSFSVTARSTEFSRMCNRHTGLADLVTIIRRAFNIAMAGTSPESLAASVGSEMTRADLDGGVVMPPCMSRLATANHLDHTARLQYSRFYFQLGGTLDGLVKIWRPRFLRVYAVRDRGSGAIQSNEEFAKSQWKGVFGEFKHTNAKNKERRNTGAPATCFSMITKHKLCPFADAKAIKAGTPPYQLELACSKKAGFAPEMAHRSPLGYVELFVAKRKYDREHKAEVEAKQQQERNAHVAREKAAEIAERRVAAEAKLAERKVGSFKRKAVPAPLIPSEFARVFGGGGGSGDSGFDSADASLFMPVAAPVEMDLSEC